MAEKDSIRQWGRWLNESTMLVYVFIIYTYISIFINKLECMYTILILYSYAADGLTRGASLAQDSSGNDPVWKMW